MTDGTWGNRAKQERLGVTDCVCQLMGLFLCDGVAPRFVFLISSDCTAKNMSDPMKDTTRHKHDGFLTLSLTIKAPSLKKNT